VGSVPAGSGGGVAGAVAESAAGGGGVGPVGVSGLLEAPGLQASAQARAFLASGGVDPRVVSVLDSVLAHHSVGVADVVSSSSPVHVQVLDIVSVDGQPVGPDNFAARDLVTEIAALGSGVRPDEIGTPWPIQSPGFFSDASSQGSLHLAFEMPGTNAGAVEQAAGAPGAGAVPGAAGAPIPGAGNYPAPAYPAAAYPAAAAPGAAVPGTVQPAVAGAVPATGVPATTAAPGSGVAEQVQQIAGAGGGGALGSDPAATVKVGDMVKFADSAVGKPYVYGGGHGDFTPQPGYDCSGFVSAVLHSAGYLTHPVDTTALPSQPGILAGAGKFVTIYDRALSGHDGHVIIDINGQFYESGGMHGAWGGGGGVEKIGRPSDDYLKTFEHVLHPEGL
jgi:cell wall-associated NlpC family hydrolase